MPIFRRAAWTVPLWVLALLAPLVLIASVAQPAQAAKPTGSRATLAGYPVWAHFSNPPAYGGRDHTIHTEVIRLINNTPKGAWIRGTIYSLSVQPVARALVAAQERGVNVTILLDGKNLTSGTKAVPIIQQLKGARFCTYAPAAYENKTRSGGACLSTSDSGDLHTKMFVFSRTTDPNGTPRSWVSWIGSANMTYASGAEQFNNAVTIYGDVALYRSLDRYFIDSWNRRHFAGNDYYDAKTRRGYYLTPTASVYASPEGKGGTDTIVARLNDLQPTKKCQVRIGMNFVTGARPQLLKLVKQFRAKGCAVFMVIGGNKTVDSDRATYTSLIKGGVLVRRTANVHDKFFMIYGKFDGRYESRVFTGSQNWSGSALHTNDEVFVKLAAERGTRRPLYNAYDAHFGSMWAVGKPCAATAYPCR